MLQKIIKYILIIALFVPLFYTPFTLFPTLYGKTAIFQILIEIAFLLYLILVLKKKIEAPKFGAVFWLLAFYLFIRIITGFLGDDAGKSFWGTQGRVGGNFTWMHFLAFFFLLTQFFREKKEWLGLIKIAVVASFLVAITGILQHFGVSVLNLWQEGGRVSGIMGNPISFAAYILFSIWLGFLVIYICVKNKNFKMFPIWLLIAVANIAALFWSETRGAIYVFLASIPFSIFLFGIFSKKMIVRLPVLLTIFFLLLVVLIFVVPDNNFVYSAIESDTIKTRVLNWQIAYDGWTESARSFLIGNGPENYDRIFDRYYNPEFLKYSFYETVGDKPHNILFEVANASGILGLLAYLSIFIVVIYVLIKSARKKRVSKASAIILSLAFLTYLGQNLAEFDSTAVLILFFLTLGFISFFNDARKETKKINASIARDYLIIFFIILIVSSLWFGNILPLRASYFTVKSSEAIYKEPANWAEYAIKAAESSSVFKDENLIHLSNSVFFLDAQGLFASFGGNKNALNIIYKELGKTIAEHPETYAYKHRFAQILSMMGECVDKKYFNEAEKTFEELDAENPNRQAVGLAWAQMKMMKGDNMGAVSVLEKLIKKNTSFPEPHWYLGLALLLVGERERGISELEKSIELGGYAIKDLSNIEFLVSLWEEDEEYEKIILLYEKITILYEESVKYKKLSTIEDSAWYEAAKEFYPRLAATYAKMGETEKAIEATEKAIKLDPSIINEARRFIELLGEANR